MDAVLNSSGRRSGTCLLTKVMAALLVCFCLAGCSIDPFGTKQEVREVLTTTGEDIKVIRVDLQRMQEEVNNLSVRLDRYSAVQERELASLKGALGSFDGRLGQANTSLLAEVDRRIAELDAKRVADKNQLVAKVNSLVDEVNALSRRIRTASASPPAGSETVAQKGFYYTVEERDTLWGIASKFREYGVTVEAIRKANNMASADSRIVSGQKLFIPVKE